MQHTTTEEVGAMLSECSLVDGVVGSGCSKECLLRVLVQTAVVATECKISPP